jgi:hypothetical protein
MSWSPPSFSRHKLDWRHTGKLAKRDWRGGRGTKLYDGMKAWFSIKHSILSRSIPLADRVCESWLFKWEIYFSVADPHWSQCGSGYVSGSSIFCNADPDPGFWWPKIGKNLQQKIFFIFFWSKIAIYFLHNGRPKRRSLHPSKENHFKIWIFLTFVGHFGPPGYGSRRPKWIRIRAKPDPDPLHWII